MYDIYDAIISAVAAPLIQGGVDRIMGGENDGDTLKKIGALVGGMGGGVGGQKISQTVNTSNNQTATLATATNITVASPGGTAGPASADPSTIVYPASQTATANQQATPSSGYSLFGPTVPGSYNLPSVYSPGMNQAGVSSGILGLSNNQLLLIGGALVMMMMMNGKGKGKAA